MEQLTPSRIVTELDRHIIGQARAKRAVAVAVRDRWRRQQLDPALAREVTPKNIVMVGPTGVGKTEIARRLADLTGAPFIKVEATKYTEVGYHGRDVESMVRDLLELAIGMVRREHGERVREKAEAAVERRVVSILLGEDERSQGRAGFVTHEPDAAEGGGETVEPDEHERSRRRIAEKLAAGKFDDREVELTVRDKPPSALLGMMGPDQFEPGVSSMIENLMPERTSRRKVTIARARAILLEEETEKLLDNDRLIEQAIERSEQTGIVFLDEIDKIAAPADGRGGADVSRQGVQRDLLPIVEGSAVSTRHGIVRTDQILFVAAGAFHAAAVSDLMPELQGRFPIRVELESLTKGDFERILTEPDGALTKQAVAMLGTEGLEIVFEPDAIGALAEMAAEANASLENIGARRLMTVMECVLEEIGFDAPERVARGDRTLRITADLVRERVGKIMGDEDLSRFVL